MVEFNVSSQEFDAQVKRALTQVGDLRPVFLQIAREFYKTNKFIFKLKSAGQYPDFKGPIIAKTWKNPGRPDLRKRDGSMTPYQ